jgi:RNA polymerase sigma-70 factor (ECF subfamily)
MVEQQKFALSWKWMIMGNDFSHQKEINYRAIYGKLFSGLLNQFGANYVAEIEDAIQNSFLKFLKIRTQYGKPDHLENWLFVVARNDVLNQIKIRQKQNNFGTLESVDEEADIKNDKDLRLQTIVFIASLKNVSIQAKILFILKNIFGLNIAEIHDSTLLSQDAIYKSISRTLKSIQLEFNNKTTEINSISVNPQAVAIVEEILYAVFNIGFDSFNEQTENIVNEDLCLDAFSLTKLLFQQYRYDTTSNLLALFCFHIARLPAKIDEGKLIPFFKQNREKWDKELISLGFNYLKKPASISKFYLEALIISKYILIEQFTSNDWKDIVKLYEIMQTVSQSPIVKLNYCFCLSKIDRTEEALKILSEIEDELPNEHVYFSLIKAKLLKDIKPREADDLFMSVVNKLDQKIRKEYLLENEFK